MASIALGWIFVGATVAAFVSLVFSGCWRRFPFFTALLALQAWQGASVNLADLIDIEWSVDSWLPIERLRLTSAILATIEVIIIVTRKMELPESQGIRLSMLFPVAVVWYAYNYILEPFPTEPFALFLMFREAVWIVLTLSLAIVAIFLLFKPLDIGPTLHRHLWLFLILMGAHAFVSPLLWLTYQEWLNEQAVYRTIAAICCLTWAFFIAKSTLALPPPQLAAKVDDVSLQHPNVRGLLR